VEARFGAAASLSALREIGALCAVADEPLPEPEEVDPEGHLSRLADTVHRLAGDLAGLGPEGRAELRRATGVAAAARVAPLLAGATALQSELLALRAAHLGRQLARLGLPDPPRGLKLHLGSGPQRLEGWINVDAHPAELSLDLRWGLPFPDASADRVFMSHMLEHLYYPEEAVPVLAEVRRVLSAEGRFRVIVPDLGRCLQAYAENDQAFFDDRRATWSWWPEARTRLEGFLSYAGAGPRPGHFLEAHKFGYDMETLEHALRQAGFSRIEPSGYMESADPALRVDDASLVAGASSGGRHYSLFVEALP
jgi:SAM-dependent methyltransferase